MKNDHEKLLLTENDAPDSRDYFGFDLGDGESAVAWLESEGAGAPLMLEIAGRKSVLTALGRQGDTVVIGEQACLADVDELSVRFKSRYLSDPVETGRLIRAFASSVLREIQKTGRMGENSQFFVGCPSGWQTQDRERYRKLFMEA